MANPKGAVVAFFGFTAVALCITSIALIADKLYPSGSVTLYYPNGAEETYWMGRCLMTNNGVNICRYGYSVGAIGACSSIVLMLAMCAPPVLSILMSVFNSIWFLAWAITSTVYSDNFASDESIPQPVRDYNAKYRTDVYALAWTCFAISLVSVPLAMSMKKGKPKSVDDKPLPGTQPPPAPEATQPAGYPVV